MINKNNIPRHVAIIMDGNRRWAIKNGISKLKGHWEGEKRIEPVIDQAIVLKIPFLTFWAFSTENWQRSEIEVRFLMRLFRHELDKKINAFHRKNIKLNIIGSLEKFPADIQKKTREWMEKTKNNKSVTVNVALSYGGRDEIIRGIKKLSNQLINQSSNNKLLREQFNNLTIQQFNNYLDTAGQPDPDLIIRTGGEKRLSGYLLWQSEYSELYFTECLWPDFSQEEFLNAITEYQNRCRRWGK